jgi:predicted O-methyltransferase YrrM
VFGYLRSKAHYIQCWRDVRRLRGVTEVETLLDFAFTHSTCPTQLRAELAELMRAVASLNPAAALEIGTHAGGTLFLLCRLSAPSATIISIDLPGGLWGGGYYRRRVPLYKRFAGEGQSMHLLRQDSHKQKTLDRVKDILGGAPLDYLFIDGDHSYEGVKQDFDMYSPLVRAGGLVAFHDIAGTGWARCLSVERFWNEVKGLHKHKEIIGEPEAGGQRFGIGMLWL